MKMLIFRFFTISVVRDLHIAFSWSRLLSNNIVDLQPMVSARRTELLNYNLRKRSIFDFALPVRLQKSIRRAETTCQLCNPMCSIISPDRLSYLVP
jgi:hypothetical protein